jgi:glycosyltransferase involved in cell wall biosynthesis
MRIVQLNPLGEVYSSTCGGAISTVIMQQTRHLARRGHDVTVLTVTDGEELYSEGRVVRLPPADRHNLSFLRRRLSDLNRRLHRWDVHFYDVYRSGYTEALRTLDNSPTAIIVHNDLITPRYLRNIFPASKIICWLHNEQRTNHRHLAESLEAADAFMCVSDHIRRWTASRYSIPDHKLRTMVNGADVEAFTPRADLNQANCSPKVLFLGRIDPNKGPDLVVDAVAELRRRGTPAHLTVAGSLWFQNRGNEMSDPFFRALREKMTALGADYRGHVPRRDVPELVRQHDIVCVLSRSEDPCPLVPLEAMASGCAVIASRRGGLPQACGSAALLVDPDEFSSIVDAMQTLAGDPATLMARKLLSLDHARQNTWAHRANELEQMLRDLVAAQPAQKKPAVVLA